MVEEGFVVEEGLVARRGIDVRRGTGSKRVSNNFTVYPGKIFFKNIKK